MTNKIIGNGENGVIEIGKETVPDGLELAATGVEAESEVEETSGLDIKVELPEEDEADLATEEAAELPLIEWEEIPYASERTDSDARGIVLPGALHSALDKTFRQSLNLRIKENKDSAYWSKVLTQGLRLNTHSERFTKTLEKGKWVKSLESEAGALTAAVEKLTHVTNAKLSGDEAVVRAKLYMGGGEYFAVPLFGCGLWYTLDPSTELELLALYREINSAKIDLGNYTYGAVFSGISGFAIESVVRFIIKHIGTTSLKYDKADDLLEFIPITELQTMLWSLNATVYPDGINYSTACVHDPQKCNHVVEGKLDVKELLRTNEAAVPTALRNFMFKSKKLTNSVTQENLEAYQKEVIATKNRRITIELQGDRKVFVNLKVPSIAGYIRSTHSWVDGITTMIEEAVVKPKDDEERNQFIADSAQATSLRQYSHFVESLEFGDGLVVDEQGPIEEILVSYSASKKIRNELISAINKFIDDATISVVGIRSFECPSCGKPHGEKPNSILPLDQLELFTQILGVKVSEVRDR